MIIGLTGNIAAGKSVVSRMLSEYGADIIDADLIARQVVEPGSQGAKQILDEFGPEYFNADGSLNRRKLGQRVFADSCGREKLNAITHPLILEEIIRRLSVSTSRIKVIDAALLIEAGLDKICDCLWLVIADDKIRLQRIIERDGFSADEAQRRIDSQQPQEEKLPLADVVINNDGDEESLARVINRIVNEEKYGQQKEKV